MRNPITAESALELLANSDAGRAILRQHADEVLARRSELVAQRERALYVAESQGPALKKKLDAALAAETKAREALKKAEETRQLAFNELASLTCSRDAAMHRAESELRETAPEALTAFINELDALFNVERHAIRGACQPFFDSLLEAQRTAQSWVFEALSGGELQARIRATRDRLHNLRASLLEAPAPELRRSEPDRRFVVPN